jgi:hypothetical protein
MTTISMGVSLDGLVDEDPDPDLISNFLKGTDRLSKYFKKSNDGFYTMYGPDLSLKRYS